MTSQRVSVKIACPAKDHVQNPVPTEAVRHANARPEPRLPRCPLSTPGATTMLTPAILKGGVPGN